MPSTENSRHFSSSSRAASISSRSSILRSSFGASSSVTRRQRVAALPALGRRLRAARRGSGAAGPAAAMAGGRCRFDDALERRGRRAAIAAVRDCFAPSSSSVQRPHAAWLRSAARPLQPSRPRRPCRRRRDRRRLSSRCFSTCFSARSLRCSRAAVPRATRGSAPTHRAPLLDAASVPSRGKAVGRTRTASRE